MNATQFAWVYLVKNGAAGMTPLYYGGYGCSDARMKHVELPWNKQYEGHREAYIKEIKLYGVNWARTLAPESDMVQQFQGTFCDAKQKEYIKGTLVLNNGFTQTWCAEGIEVSTVFEMMAKADEIKQEFAEIFGENS